MPGQLAAPLLVFAAITCASAGIAATADELVGVWWAVAGPAAVAATAFLVRRAGGPAGVAAAAATALLAATLIAGAASGSSAVADVTLGVVLAALAIAARDTLLVAGGLAIAACAAAIGAATGEVEHTLVPLCTGLLLGALGLADARRRAIATSMFPHLRDRRYS